MMIRLRKSIARHCPHPITTTPLDGLLLFRADAPTKMADVVYEPRFCIIVQGRKDVMLCDQMFTYDASKYLITAVDLPLSARITQASPQEPYLALCITLDPAQIAELLLEMDSGRTDAVCQRCLCVSELTSEILDPVSRLVHLLDHPQDIPILRRVYMRELLYRLLHSAQGPILRQIATAGSNLAHLNRAIGWIRAHYAKPIEIADVARIAGMSTPSFHRHFRAATMMSPLQYRTRLRLLEARRLLMSGAKDAAEVGFEVGYESPSQFSREYRRMFGVPPGRDGQRLRRIPVENILTGVA